MTGSVFRLVYRSHSRIPVADRKAELGSIFSVSRSGNSKKNVTGALLTHGDWFVQALEGDEATVRDLYDVISNDRRHERLSVLTSERVGERVFSRWAMAEVSDDGGSDIPLLMSTTKGGITPAAPRPSDPGREVVLAAMRDSIRGELPAV